jgi:Protein of unknown function (DUF1302)
MRSRVIAVFCLCVLLLVIPGIALGYDWTLGDWGNLNLRGEMTYALKLRTEWPTPRFVDPRSPYYVSGDANFRKWELGNNALIGTAEVILDSKNVTFFGRMVGFLDFAYFDEDRFNTETREHAAYNITDGLEFYVEGRTGGLTTRWGRQILQWGESTAPIWAPGVNVVSPFFLQRVSSVGFNQRSWQVPTFMGWAGYEVSEALSFEGVWAPDFDPRYFMPVVGTYMSPADILGFGVESELVEDLRPLDWVDQQQYGGTIRMVFSELNNLELGLYYYHYLSRWPMLKFAEVWTPKMYIEWPELDLIGLSFSQAIQTWGLNLQVGGEVTYRPNEPLQLYVPSSPFIASAVGLPEVPAGFEKSNTIAWDINSMRFFFDVFDFTPYTFQLSPILEFYGKINLDYEDSIGYGDPQFTAYYNLICPLQTSDMIDNARLDLSFSAMGGLHSQANLLHTLGFSAGVKYGNNWEALVGYNLAVGTVKQDPQGQWTWDRDSLVLKLTYYFI